MQADANTARSRRRSPTDEEVDEWVRRNFAKAPPPTPAQLALVRRLFRNKTRYRLGKPDDEARRSRGDGSHPAAEDERHHHPVLRSAKASVLTAQEIADDLRLSKAKVFRMLRAGEIDGAHKFGNTWRVLEEVYVEWRTAWFNQGVQTPRSR